MTLINDDTDQCQRGNVKNKKLKNNENTCGRFGNKNAPCNMAGQTGEKN